MSSPQDAEWRRVVAGLDLEQARQDHHRATMQEQLDGLRSDLASGYSELLRANQEHAQRVEAERQAWLASQIDGYTPTHEPAQHRSQGAPSVPPVSGSVGAGRPQNPHAIELERQEAADLIAGWSMQEYAAHRAEFGVRSPTDMSRLFGD